ncbi:MAG: hypothetical protein U1E17_17675 [Geminicoccaceae bacterium]
MNGLLNLLYPLLDALDWSLGFLPAVLRVVLLGVLSGAVAMGLYVLLSNQDSIRARKEEMQRIRVDLAAARDDFNETMRLSKRNLAASFGLLGVVTGPAILSSLPLLAVIGWLSAHYGSVLPAPGTPVPLAFEPAGAAVTVEPAAALTQGAAGPELAWPAPGALPRFLVGSAPVYEGPPPGLPAGIVHQKVWWNWLLGNPAGYVAPNPSLEAITFELAPLVLVPGVPSWLGGWEAVYFIAVFASSLLIKFGFRIE